MRSEQLDLWRSAHRDCATESPFGSIREARLVLSDHSGHGGACHQYLAAHAYSLGSEDGLDYAD
ncbi:hypothetical protein ACWDSF_06465 [Nocardia beijingensis]